MSHELIIVLVSGLVSALLTLFIKTITETATFKTVAKEIIAQHVETHHKSDVWAAVKEVVDQHDKHCTAPKDIECVQKEVKELKENMTSLRMAVAYLVKQSGGDPREFGLI